MWDLATGKSVAEFDPFAGTKPTLDTGLYKPTVATLAFSPDGKTLAAHINFFDDELPRFDHMQIWDLPSGKLRATFDGKACLFTPDGETLISGCKGQVELRSTRTLAVLATLKGTTEISPGDLSRDGKTIVAIGNDKTIQLWDLSQRKLSAVLKGHDRAITAVAISPDGNTLASGREDGSIWLWNSDPP